MRGALLSLATAAILLCAAPRHASAIPVHDALVSAAPTVVALQNPVKDVQVDINVHHSGAWYRSPVWIAIGVIALVLLVILIVLLVRGGGGGTTIIRE